ncbi:MULTISPECIES: DUF3828 domain-containing protein [Commensalibacter]|uniref:DUF3828 domain-containing protein n=2 Tax=Commensalibacter TaxID=1079922 RepID=W7DKQ6_9PROT|nr:MULTISPECIES: DUF3828 domain-containing protein [Commensalibacter]EUK17917.1 hypothetical protein COMX_07990 [Commensalibacter papalotli (ex Servin-Garciduenas et al. 2014)]CAI3941802.1 unnamed protein product [Commensalibacter papalotli (ex Botero et al. 2024)]CAI3949162.1 unnamed protein product [Commensalibacter papalotli (ex Botero et al. 2024)]
MLINQVQRTRIYWCAIIFIGTIFLLQSKAYAQESPIKTIQDIYSSYQPQSDNGISNIDPADLQNSHFFSPDFLNVIKEDEKLTSAQGDNSIIDYDFICNCQDTMDGIIVRKIETLQQTQNTARVKVSFDFILNGSDNFQKDELFSNEHPGQQQTYFNLIKRQNHWLIDDVTDEKNVGIKNGWKEELRKYYHSSIK